MNEYEKKIVEMDKEIAEMDKEIALLLKEKEQWVYVQERDTETKITLGFFLLVSMIINFLLLSARMK